MDTRRQCEASGVRSRRSASSVRTPPSDQLQKPISRPPDVLPRTGNPSVNESEASRIRRESNRKIHVGPQARFALHRVASGPGDFTGSPALSMCSYTARTGCREQEIDPRPRLEPLRTSWTCTGRARRAATRPGAPGWAARARSDVPAVDGERSISSSRTIHLKNCCRARKSAETVAGLTRSRLCRTNVSMSRRCMSPGPPGRTRTCALPLRRHHGTSLVRTQEFRGFAGLRHELYGDSERVAPSA